jgi:hypothetical protein
MREPRASRAGRSTEARLADRDVELVFSDEDAPASTSVEVSELEALLESTRAAVFRHPIAVQAAFAALVAEGRRYAETEEGAELLEGLLRSPGLSRLRVAWEVLTMSAFVEKPEGALPSVFVDTLMRGLKLAALEPMLARLLERRSR